MLQYLKKRWFYRTSGRADLRKDKIIGRGRFALKNSLKILILILIIILILIYIYQTINLNTYIHIHIIYIMYNDSLIFYIK